jgi:glutaredoxin
MKSKATFYHIGCPVCVGAERGVVQALDRNRFDIEEVNLSEQKARIPEAAKIGVKSVPALVLDGQPYHVNFGAELGAIK